MYARCACKQSFTCKAQRRGYRDSICFVCVNRPRGFTTTFLTLQHLRLAVQHTLYIHNHPCNSVCDSNEHKLWSTNDGLPSLRSFRRCCKTRPQQHTTMCREHLNRTDRHNLCMRMQRTAQALLCGAKHDCTMNALRTGHSQQNRQGSRPHGDDTDNLAGPIDNMPSAWPQSSCRC